MSTEEDSKKRILVNAINAEECRVAIVAGGELEDIHVETTSREQTKGNIYKAVIVRVEPGLQAAFVEFDKTQKHGFLQFREIRPEYYRPKNGEDAGERPRIQDVVHKKQEILVQVEKDARDMKGASLTTYISLPGRYMVMMPGEKSRVGISRKIEGSEDRGQIRDILKNIELPGNAGFIVRTVGLDQTEAVLKADVDHLVARWDDISNRAEKAKGPCLIYEEHDIVTRALRDYLTDDVDEILIDDREISRTVKEYLKDHAPKLQKRVKLYREKTPIFAKFGVEGMLDSVHERKVSLPSGGSIVIDTTEALTSIDVNSGKSHGERDIEDLALKTNLEAVKAIARQLRLRDIGGLIVLDLIDMRPAKNRKAVENALKEQLKKDKAKTDIAYISKFGMLEMSRERMRPSVRDTNYTPCAVCGGKGHYPTPEFLALTVLRKLQEIVVDEAISKIAVTLPVAAANYLLNAKRAELLEIEKRTGRQIVIEAGDMSAGEHKLVIERQGEQPRELARESRELREPARESAREHVAQPPEQQRQDSAQQRQDGLQPKKKRRRKRKRGGRGGEPGEGMTAESMSVPAPEHEGADETGLSETASYARAEAAEGPDESAESASTVSTAEAARPRKRRRPRRKRKPEGGAQSATMTEGGVNASDVSSEPSAPEPVAPEPVVFEPPAPEPPQQEPSAPKRRRRPPRRKPAVAGESETAQNQPSEDLSGKESSGE